MNKGVRTGIIIFIILTIILCAITIFVKDYSDSNIISDDMVIESMKLDSIKKDTEKLDSNNSCNRKTNSKTKKKKTSKGTVKTGDNILPVIPDE